jgi:hypothetical protein
MQRNARRPGIRARRILPLVATVGVAAMLLSVMAAPASAHEGRKVGKYELVVGFGDEPAYAGSKNSVQLMVSDASGKPVTDLDVSKVAVHGFYGTKADPALPKIVLPLEPHFGDEWGTPGDYQSFFVPSAPGRYSFHVHGAINGQKVNQVFTSGPKTFDDVLDPTKTAFPALKDPSTGQLAQRLDREVPRLTASVQSVLALSRAAERRADGKLAQARQLAFAGMLLGLIGIVLAGIAMAAARSARRRAQAPPVPAPPAPLRADPEPTQELNKLRV